MNNEQPTKTLKTTNTLLSLLIISILALTIAILIKDHVSVLAINNIEGIK